MSQQIHANSIDYMLMEYRSKKDLSEIIGSQTDVKSLLDSLPYIAALLDSERKIIYANEVFTHFLNVDSIYQILELLPGEALECKNHKLNGKQCGTSKACSYCGMRLAIEESKHHKGKVTRECLITRNDNGREIAIDYEVTASTLLLNGDFFTMLTLVDISHEKRRRVLERIFFHDILNKAGSLNGLVDLMKNFDDYDQVNEHLKVIDTISHGIIEEIEAQRLLAEAETGELVVNDIYLNVYDIIKDAVTQISQHKVANGKLIGIDFTDKQLKIFSDDILLKRVLINMLKNALEASSKGETVLISCKKNGSMVLFNVHNKSFIPENVQAQMFQRSFSTKAKNRGLGTYSMKLIGEQYLVGKVFFESSMENGTQFYLALPVSKSNFEI